MLQGMQRRDAKASLARFMGQQNLADLPSEAERAGSALAASRSLAQGMLSDRAAQCSGDSASGLSTSAFHNTHLALNSFGIANCMHASFGQRENSMVQEVVQSYCT